MQHIPHHSLEDIERSREEMAAFMNERHGPNLTLTGEDIHAVFCIVDPDQRAPWSAVPDFCRPLYEDFAKELNRIIEARQAWFEGEDVTVSAVRCPQCNEMLQAEHAEGHACWLEVR